MTIPSATLATVSVRHRNNQPRHLFESTQSLTDNLGELRTTTDGALIGLWNLRVQVKGLAAELGEKAISLRESRILAGSGFTRLDFQKLCFATTWEDQQLRFAKILLFECISLFECWLDEVVGISIGNSVREEVVADVIKSFQFSSTRRRFNPLPLLASHRSQFMCDEMVPVLGGAKIDKQNIDELIIAFRFFKEVRNAYTHSTGRTTQKVLDAYSDFMYIVNLDHTKIHLDSPFAPLTLVLGERVSLNLYQVTACFCVVHHIIATYDSILAETKGAEQYFLDRLSRDGRTSMMFPAKGRKREDAVRSAFMRASLPCPTDIVKVCAFLTAKGVLTDFGIS